MTERDSERFGQKLSRVAVAYSLWALSAGLALFALLWIRVFFFVDLPLVIFMVDPWVQRAIDRIGTVVLGLGWLVLAVGSEAYFRRLHEQPHPARYVLKVYAWEVAALAVSYGGHLLIR